MSDRPTMQEQEEAFEAYKSAKEKLDSELTAANANVARAAWWRFLHVFEGNTAEPLTK